MVYEVSIQLTCSIEGREVSRYDRIDVPVPLQTSSGSGVNDQFIALRITTKTTDPSSRSCNCELLPGHDTICKTSATHILDLDNFDPAFPAQSHTFYYNNDGSYLDISQCTIDKICTGWFVRCKTL